MNDAPSLARLGVLVAGSRHADRFSQEEQSFFLAVAHWLGLVARRAQRAEMQGRG